MRVPSRRATLLAGLAVIVLTHAVALGGVWWNRSGEPDSVLRLSERELRPEGVWNRENTGLALRLEWRAAPAVERDEGPYGWPWADGNRSPAWLGREKMIELGFRPPAAGDDARTVRERGREVFLVLEFDGPARRAYGERLRAWAEREMALPALDPRNEEFGLRAKRAREVLDSEARRSRLFAVDAGRSAEALRAAYPDRTRHAIVRAEIVPAYPAQGERGPQGYIRRVVLDAVHVPYAQRAVFGVDGAGLPERSGDDVMRATFDAELALGRRLEPWLRSVTRRAAR